MLEILGECGSNRPGKEPPMSTLERFDPEKEDEIFD